MEVLSMLRDLLGPRCERSPKPLSARWDLGDGTARDLVFDPYNRRLKLYGVDADDLRAPRIRYWRDGLKSGRTPYSKLIIYALPGDEMAWVRGGYVREGVIWGFFADGADAWLWSAFADDGRDLAPREREHEEIVSLAAEKPTVEPESPADLVCRRAVPDDAQALSALLREVFAEYPTPLDADTIRTGIEAEHHVYRLLEDTGGRLAAAASAEIDHDRGSAELTDCATRPEHRGAGLMGYLLRRLERDMTGEYGITDLYTIARADEVGMNCAFSKLGWIHTGRLINNCRMPRGWESMNLWCRPRPAPARGNASRT